MAIRATLPYMKAITIWQPYAAAISSGLKHYETRHWPTKYRGPLIIHASMRPLDRLRRELANKYNLLDATAHIGEFIAICDLTDCIKMTPEFIARQPQSEHDFGYWTANNYAWQLENIRPLDCGIKIRGNQGLWSAPDIYDMIDVHHPNMGTHKIY